MIRIRQLGGVAGNGVVDDTAGLEDALLKAQSADTALYLDPGVYRITRSIDVPDGVSIVGAGAPKIAPFPQVSGDKEFLRPGQKSKLPGSTILLDGTADKTFNSVRSDRFSSATYGLRYSGYGGVELRDFAIIQNMDVRNEFGQLTNASNDNRADSYDVGLMLQNTNSVVDNVTIFGYFNKAGLWIHNEDGDDVIDPDYNRLVDCLIASGLAITGHDAAAGPAAGGGNTGTIALGCGIYGADHHTRNDGDYTIPAVYIDGLLTGSIGKIRGHSFTGCNLRTYANDAIVLDHADDIQFSTCVWEFAVLSVPNANTSGGFKGTSNTGDLFVFGGAGTSQPRISDFINETSGSWVFAGGVFDNFIAGRASAGVRLSSNSEAPYVQLTDDFSSTVSGWVIRKDNSTAEDLNFLFDNGSKFQVTKDGALRKMILPAPEAQTISGGVITVNSSSCRVLNEGGAASDDLDTINGGTLGQRLMLKAGSISQNVVCKDLTGNLRLAGDFTLDNGQDRLELEYDGTNWCEITRSDNT